jgi:hypothetical protein
MEHAIHLSAKHVAAVVAPTPLSRLVSKIKASLHALTDLDILDEQVEQILSVSQGGDEDDLESLMSDAALGDALGIALALAAQVSDVQTFHLIVHG